MLAPNATSVNGQAHEFLIQPSSIVNTTPPVPEYPSSFATVGGAATGILRAFYNSDVISVNLTSATLPGVSLQYSSLSQIARDNSLSMIYTGWYFRKAALDGEEQGKQIGSYVFHNSFQENED